MTEDITSLQIRILYDSVSEAERRLRALEDQGRRTGDSMGRNQRAANSLTSQIGKLALAYVSVTSVVAGFRAIIQTTAEFQNLNAQLVTATGSASNAAKAFEAIKDFAAKTPYDLQQATGAFIQLVNRGLEPSERALTSYGNTASSMGRSLADMVLAVSNATSGEFENLKGFGIRAQKVGNDVNFTFRGVSTTVKNTTEDIEKYFIELGEKNFAGGMQRQSETLGGAFSNLGDSWDVLKATIGEAGLGEAVESAVRMATEAVSEFTAMLESGQIQAALDSWGIAFEGFSEAWAFGFDELRNVSREAYDGFFDDSTSVWDDVSKYLQGVPVMFTALVQEIALRLWGIVDAIGAVGAQAYAQFKADLDALIGLAAAAGSAIANALSGNFSGAWEGLKGDINKTLDENIARTNKAAVDYQNRIQTNADVVTSGVSGIMNEAADRLERQGELSKEADARRAAFDAAAEARAKDRADRLKEFGIKSGATTPTGAAKGGKGGGGGGGVSQEQKEWETLEKSLRDQETLISESYERRFALIEKNTRDGSAYQAELEISLTDKFAEEQEKRFEKMKKEPETMIQAFALEEKAIEDSYAKRKEIILSATELTEAERLKMLEEAQLQYTASIRKHETEKNKVTLGLASDFFGNLAGIAGAFGKKGAKIAKAAAITQTIIKTYESATSAYAALAGIQYVGPALGAAAAGAAIAGGLANVQKIKSQDDSGGYAGAFAIGGYIPGNKFGIVGEAGPELVRGPAVVTSAQSTKDRGFAKPGGGSDVVVNIVNMSGEPVTEKRTKTGDKETIEFVIGKAADRVADDISKGGTKIAKAIQSTYNLSRGR